MNDHPNGKPKPNEKRYGKPAESGRMKASGVADRKYGKPVASGDRKYGKPAAPTEQKYGKPAVSGEQKYGKPAPPSMGRPMEKNLGVPTGARPEAPSGAKPTEKSAGAGEGKYGKPAVPADRKYGKPPMPKSRGFTKGPPSDRKYGKPAAPSEQKYGKPAVSGEQKYGKPAPPSMGRPMEKNLGVPTGARPEAPSGAKPTEKSAGAGERKYGKPAAPADRKYGKPPMPKSRGFTKGLPSDRKYGKPARGPSRPDSSDPRVNPRFLALNVLLDVTKADAYASLALSKRLRESSLAPRDRDLATELAYGVLERRIALDYVIDARLTRNDVEPVVRDILRLGAYQMLYLDRIPDSAAVDESVKLCGLVDREPFSGLVNGVLRGIAREKDALSWPDREKEPLLALSVRYSLPLWIVQRLYEDYGPEETEAMAAYREEDGGIIVRPNPEKRPSDGFEAMMARKHWDFAPAKLPGLYRVSGAGDVGLDKEFIQGYYSVQGEGSVLAAMAVAPSRGMTVLDACAAPGGKTAYLAQAMGGTGRVYAWDVHEHRVELIRSMAKRLFLDSVRPAVRDATLVKEDFIGALDAVLLDVPCSGLGVMLSKPDVKYRASAEAVASLATLQKALLNACCQYVKPGGTLVYSTCTILPEENTRQIDGFLGAHPEFALDGEGLAAAMPDFLKERAASGWVQLLPHRDHMEGFFIARMVRTRP